MDPLLHVLLLACCRNSADVVICVFTAIPRFSQTCNPVPLLILLNESSAEVETLIIKQLLIHRENMRNVAITTLHLLSWSPVDIFPYGLLYTLLLVPHILLISMSVICIFFIIRCKRGGYTVLRPVLLNESGVEAFREALVSTAVITFNEITSQELWKN